jgi:type II secretory pathway component GspD/PulD (secretin)
MKISILLSILAIFGFWSDKDSQKGKTPQLVDAQVTEQSVRDAAQHAALEVLREAAERAAKEKADAENSAKAIAEAAAKAAAEAVVKEAVTKAATDAAAAAAAAAAKTAAEETAKAYTDEKAEKEEQREKLRQIESRVFRLNHASAGELATKFNEMWNGEFGQNWKVTKMAVAFQESNAIMITAPRLILDACERMIMELDVEARQVYIEARFVELSNNASHKLGIDWQMLDGMTGSAKLGGGIQSTELGKGVASYKREESTSKGKTTYDLKGTEGAGGGDGDITYFNGTLDFSEMYLILRALESSEDARVFSNPKIIVSSGKKAKVDMTEKYPNVTISAKRTSSGGGSDSLDLSMNMAAIPGEDKFMFAKEAFFSWGIELEVTPRINTNGLINVSIVPTISSQTDWVTAGANDTSDKENNAGSYSAKYPVINVQRLITEFNMASETTAVIGGLSRTTEKQVDNGIPWLRDIWWIGPKLFGSKIRIKEQKEIIVFVTVGLVNPREMKKDVGLPKNAVLGRQFTNGQRVEPGDRMRGAMEGVGSLDLRPLEEQAKDPLPEPKKESENIFSGIPRPFTKHKKQ